MMKGVRWEKHEERGVKREHGSQVRSGGRGRKWKEEAEMWEHGTKGEEWDWGHDLGLSN